MRRSTVVMLIVLALVAGIYWYMQQPENLIERTLKPTPTATTVSLGTVIRSEQGSVTRIVIQASDGSSIELDKTSGIWQLITGEGSQPADPKAVDVAASGLLDLRILNKIAPAPEPTAIALEPPAYRFSITLSDGSQVNFDVGAKTVTQSGYYVQLSDKTVYVVPAYSIDSLVKFLANPPYLPTVTPQPTPETP